MMSSSRPRSASGPMRPARTRLARCVRLVGTLSLALSAACSNYDFARARNADGEFDIPMLIEDLDASGESTLIDWFWIPLIYLDMTTFSRADAALPAGYRLNDATSYGPLFLVGAGDMAIIDAAGKTIEHSDSDWLLLGLWQSTTTRVESVVGPRVDDRSRALFGLLNWENVHYLPPPAR